MRAERAPAATASGRECADRRARSGHRRSRSSGPFGIGRANRRGQARVARAQRLVHAPRDPSIREVALRLGALLDDVRRLGPVHLEQAARAIAPAAAGSRRRARSWHARCAAACSAFAQRLDVVLAQTRFERCSERRADQGPRRRPARAAAKPCVQVSGCCTWTQRRWRCRSRNEPRSTRMSKISAVAGLVLAQQIVVRAAVAHRQIEDLLLLRLAHAPRRQRLIWRNAWPALVVAIQQRGDDLVAADPARSRPGRRRRAVRLAELGEQRRGGLRQLTRDAAAR